MLPNEVNGLPLHILLVHVVVIVLPAAALLTVLGAVWPAFRRKLGVVTPIVALVGLVSVPLATNAGEWLLQRVAPTPLVQAHVALGDTLLPWAVGQFVVATALWAWYRWFAALPAAAARPGARPGARPAAAGPAVPASAVAATPAVAHAAPSAPAGGSVPRARAKGSASTAAAAGATGAPAGSRAATDGPVLLQGTDPYAPIVGAATPGIRPTAPARRRAGRGASTAVSIVAIVVALIVSGGTVAKVVQIGESGSTAVWQGSFSPDPLAG